MIQEFPRKFFTISICNQYRKFTISAIIVVNILKQNFYGNTTNDQCLPKNNISYLVRFYSLSMIWCTQVSFLYYVEYKFLLKFIIVFTVWLFYNKLIFKSILHFFVERSSYVTERSSILYSGINKREYIYVTKV